jgi:hypothetical protein
VTLKISVNNRPVALDGVNGLVPDPVMRTSKVEVPAAGFPAGEHAEPTIITPLAHSIKTLGAGMILPVRSTPLREANGFKTVLFVTRRTPAPFIEPEP